MLQPVRIVLSVHATLIKLLDRLILFGKRSAVSAAAFSLLSLSQFGQSMSQDLPREGSVNPQGGPSNAVVPVSLQTDKEFLLSIIILLFGALTIFLFYRLLHVPTDKKNDATRMYTVVLIIIGTLLLISAGYNSQQIAPALGLFGTIAGYLLGRSDRRFARRKKPDTEDRND